MIAIIGKIGVGKSFFLNKMKERGLKVFSCDEYIREIYHKNNVGYNAINSQIGSFLNDENGISKEKIKEWIYVNPSNLDLLEKIIYPLIFKAINLGKFHFVEIPKIIGKNFDFSNLFDNIVCLKIPEKNRQKNWKNRNVDNFLKKQIDAKNDPKIVKNALFGKKPIVDIYANNWQSESTINLILNLVLPNR
ncbi:dephospho-CoA kinase [Mycoplasma tauri]|uniref:dephospho-CoA kinase n=1 Tax=Mycoplasma tauri TaxID=547987 RepID=UPI0019677E48|nr:dephospho-CoA kinase [Mycoplasma tauri]MBZ4203386.1 dephospho-CoA kinase [Mycoplasma tauri]MBZ4212697.1 dephospho-CoA kinase [Mycoplasma tauri]MBZ4218035.1 dephospho-CoA kinase [Mycoplasma tauri]QSB07434.1 dephospho-CoA kinase [Mycoplasma tauri]